VTVDGRERVGQVRYVHFGQKAEFAQVHPEYGGALPVRQPHRAQHGPVPAEADQQVRPATELSRGDRDRSTVQPADLLLDAEDLDAPARRPVEHRGDRRRGVTPRVQHEAGRVHVSGLPSSS
jgi:hypothetical protein